MTDSVKTTCYHCGDNCDSDPILHDNRSFCCDGCKLVYDLLQENHLSTYYKLEKSPGVSRKQSQDNDFAYLDDVQVQEKLLDFDDGTIANVTFFVPQIHCSSCIWVLEHLYKLNGAIRMSRVNFPKKEVTISFLKQQASLKDIVTLLARIGYEPKITFAETSVKKAGKINRSLYYKLGVAAFCFGNIMLLSFPEYLDNLREQDAFYVNLFNYLNIVLALPVFFYSATDFFRSAWHSLKEKIINIDVPISIGIVTLLLVSLEEIVFRTGSGYLDSLTGLVFFLLIGRVFQQKSYDVLSFERDYKSFFPVAVTLIRNEQYQQIPLDKLQKGDRLLIRNGELIPADSILLSSHATVDYSFVTGESEPLEVVAGEKLYAGGKLSGSGVEVETIKDVSQSYLTGLWNNEVFGKEKANSLEAFSNKVSKYFTLVILAIAVSSAGYWVFNDVALAVKAFTSVLIIACPCALALSIPFTFGNALRICGRNKLFLKHIGVVQSMAEANYIVLDKTGTLTDTAESEIRYYGEPLVEKEKVWIKSLAHQSIHPLSKRIEQQLEGVRLPVTNFEELPGKGTSGQIEGVVIKMGKRSYVVGYSPDKDKADHEVNSTKVYLAINGVLKGFFSLTHRYREGVQPLAKALSNRYDLAVVSGDHDTEKAALENLFQHKAVLRFNKSPEDKLNYIKALQEEHQKVMMVGDGLNDAGALQQSDVGLAVSEDVMNFSPSSDGIMDASRVSWLNRFLHYARLNKKIVIAGFILSFLYNIVGLSFAVQGTLSPIIAAILMPLSSITIVAFAFAATHLAAIISGLSISKE